MTKENVSLYNVPLVQLLIKLGLVAVFLIEINSPCALFTASADDVPVPLVKFVLLNHLTVKLVTSSRGL